MGSPPPVRGKGNHHGRKDFHEGITPACAGKSAVLSSTSAWIKDHPRLCGEKLVIRDMAARSVGSPPPVRGKVFSAFPFAILTRITPACAGKSPGCSNARGICAGSPPPVRGKAVPGGGFLYGSRITPACAGKSIKTPFKKTFVKDHPRLCGEKSTPSETTEGKLGSPPPVRGKGGFYYFAMVSLGITPACAGKSVLAKVSLVLA